MSTISPNSLLVLTVDVIARNYRTLCHKVLEEIHTNERGSNSVYSKLVFKDGESLPPNIAERLLRRLVEVYHNTVTSDILKLFGDPEICRLRRFCIGSNVKVNTDDRSLEFFMKLLLKRQELIELDLSNLITDFSEDYSNSKIAVSLKYLTLCPTDLPSVNFILSFNNLKHLDVSNSEYIGDEQLQMFASTLKNLENLDISSTNITSVEAFGVLKGKLKSLSLYDTPLIFRDLLGLLKFSNLEFLDISQSSTATDEFRDMLVQFLTATHGLQSLVFLDVSGAGEIQNIDNKALKCFLESHLKLRFLGLLNVDQSSCSSSQIPDDVEVAGDESLKQLLTCLRRYRKRPPFLVIALRELYRLSSQEPLKHDVEQRKIIIKLLLDIMTRYMDGEGRDLQVAASACLFGCVKDDNSRGPNSLHTSILSEVVSVIIQVLTTFPNEKQIQRNCLLTLYNNYILAEATFDGFVLSKLILKAITLFPNHSVTAVALDICAYLCAKITMEETLMLGTPTNIKKLLSIIDAQVSSKTVDVLLHCALRVLWNLTDETPKTCQMVMELNGLQLIMRALEAFDDTHDVLKKILGILNNLAEVVTIRPLLLTDNLLALLRNFLDASYQIDVSYFAAGVICNLAIDWPADLAFTCGTHSDFLSFVGTAVTQWKQTDKAMVGYRTFKPFVPLLRSHFADVQLWALWAIHHVCFHKVVRYGKICKDEGILEILKDLWSRPGSRSDVKKLAIEAANSAEEKNDENCMTS